MRKILFRGKCAHDGKWHEGNLVHQTEFYGDPVDCYHIVDIGEFDVDYYTSTEVIPETIGQFTGVLDMNGNKVFEGDIIKANSTVYICLWDECNFEFGLRNNKESLGMAYVYPYVEVIGNIYDNPELLED